MGTNIIAAIPLGEDTLAVWFENGISKKFTSENLGIADKTEFLDAHPNDDGSALVWGAEGSMASTDLLERGEDANYVEDEKRRILKSLSTIRRQASFSQTRLGEAAGIRQSVISRIEGCEISPQINTLLKLLAPLGKTLAIVDLEDK